MVNVEKFDPESLKSAESKSAASAVDIDRDAKKILEQNERLADEVAPKEAEGIRDLNQLRILIGLRPCLMDPKLCAASRDHSKDMAELNFYAHESPVPGKKTPGDRARNFKTTSNRENIYKGIETPQEANRGWWHSPGHHINMLAPEVRRVGLGVHGKHWTQMFGN